jgi:GAF domain-containing protein
MFVALRTGEVSHGRGDTATLAIPLKVRDQVVGVIDGRKRHGTGPWTSQEIELLQALTEQLNAALEGARLYRDTQQRAARDRMVGQATTRMRETLDVETVLETAVEEISQALGLAALDLRLSTEAGLEAKPVNSTGR